MKKKFITVLFSITALLFSQNIFATITIRLENQKSQGDLHCKVTKNKGDCGTALAWVTLVCENATVDKDEKCPTNEDLRSDCSGAIVTWISNTDLDYEVGNILSVWNAGSGTQSGSYTRTYYNTGTSETAVISYSWSTLATGGIEIVIDEV